MGHHYAGVLGPLAFLTVLLRGLKEGAAATEVLITAWLALWIFAAIGYVAGRVAGWMIDESTRFKVSAELAARQAQAVPAGTQDT